MYIINPVKHFEERSAGFLATHPPLVDRINRLRALRRAKPVESVTEA
jgi:Zn-dependent protease with chaperone function